MVMKHYCEHCIGACQGFCSEPCPGCRQPEEKCVCDVIEGDDKFAYPEDDRPYEDDLDCFGRNYSDADPGL